MKIKIKMKKKNLIIDEEIEKEMIGKEKEGLEVDQRMMKEEKEKRFRRKENNLLVQVLRILAHQVLILRRVLISMVMAYKKINNNELINFQIKLYKIIKILQQVQSFSHTFHGF
jgi:hypothetical protein